MRSATVGAIEFRLLGPMELRLNGEFVELGTVKQWAVLAVMLASAGRPVTIDALVDRVWDDEPPDHVRNTVYSYVSRLRGLFRGHMTAPLVRSGGGGYVLDVPPEAVDMHRFRRLAERARESATDEHSRRDMYCEALNQWRGTPMAGPSGTWAERVRHGLEQQRISAAAECCPGSSSARWAARAATRRRWRTTAWCTAGPWPSSVPSPLVRCGRFVGGPPLRSSRRAGESAG